MLSNKSSDINVPNVEEFSDLDLLGVLLKQQSDTLNEMKISNVQSSQISRHEDSQMFKGERNKHIEIQNEKRQETNALSSKQDHSTKRYSHLKVSSNGKCHQAKLKSNDGENPTALPHTHIEASKPVAHGKSRNGRNKQGEEKENNTRIDKPIAVANIDVDLLDEDDFLIIDIDDKQPDSSEIHSDSYYDSSLTWVTAKVNSKQQRVYNGNDVVPSLAKHNEHAVNGNRNEAYKTHSRFKESSPKRKHTNTHHKGKGIHPEIEMVTPVHRKGGSKRSSQCEPDQTKQKQRKSHSGSQIQTSSKTSKVHQEKTDQHQIGDKRPRQYSDNQSSGINEKSIGTKHINSNLNKYPVEPKSRHVNTTVSLSEHLDSELPLCSFHSSRSLDITKHPDPYEGLSSMIDASILSEDEMIRELFKKNGIDCPDADFSLLILGYKLELRGGSRLLRRQLEAIKGKERMVDELRREQKQNMELRKLRDKIEGTTKLVQELAKRVKEK